MNRCMYARNLDAVDEGALLVFFAHCPGLCFVLWGFWSRVSG